MASQPRSVDAAKSRIKPGKPLNMNLVDEDIRQLMNVDRIESVRYDIQPVGNAYELVYYVQEKTLPTTPLAPVWSWQPAI